MKLSDQHLEIQNNGFTVINDIFTEQEVNEIIKIIDQADQTNPTFKRSEDLFAIRQFLKEIPALQKLILNDKLKNLINQFFGNNYFVTKSIYFDKPKKSNWFVAYHQDLTVSVDKRIENAEYGPWTIKQNQFAVQPPINILEKNFTFRIHLDDTNEQNGALKVIPGSHLKGVYRPENIDWKQGTETSCNTRKGGVMIMRPLLLHASSRTTNNVRRRVAHIEFSNQKLAEGLSWPEKVEL